MNDRWSDWFVIPTWIISIRRARRSMVVLVEILTVILIAAGCNLRASPEGVEAVTPSAFVSVFPRLFCPGEILTASYDGGP